MQNGDYSDKGSPTSPSRAKTAGGRSRKQQNAPNKLTGKFGYETCYETNDYHIISGREGLESTQFSILPNTDVFAKTFADKRAPSISRYRERMPLNLEMKVNAKRFENVNKDPQNCSLTKSISQVDFKK